MDAQIGVGGMGEVYRAHDTKLGRNVAIKLLPALMTQDPDALARLGREARMLATLNHPHIAAIYGIEDLPAAFDGAQAGEAGSHGRALVLELIDGETLEQRIARGPVPIVDALRIAGQIADALAAAHDKDIVHRDLKPANIKLTTAGAVKVLDFGIAKAAAPRTEETGTTFATREGAVIGTPAYMSPEQTRGEDVDRRSDVWSFGCVLYEMLTGRRAFAGGTTSDTIAAILSRDPDWSALPPATSASIRALLARCLHKDKTRRLRDLADVRLALDDAAPIGTGPGGAGGGTRIWPRERMAWIGLTGILAAAAIGGTILNRDRSNPPPASSPQAASYVYDVPLPPSLRHYGGHALSPDGHRLAVVTQGPPGSVPDPRLWIRDLDSTAAWQLVSGAGDEVPHYPFWSPDGRSLAFFLMGHLVRVDLPSVVPIEICVAPDGRGGAWMDDGTIIFAASPTSGLMRVDAGGGRPEEFVSLKATENGLKYPSAVGNRRVIYWADAKDYAESELRLMSLDDPAHAVPIVKAVAGAVYDRGTLFYLRAGLWVGQPFDPGSARLSGAPRPIALDRPWVGNIGSSAVSANAGHIAAANIGLSTVQPTWFDRAGGKLGELAEPAASYEADISADGKRVAVTRFVQAENSTGLWILDADTGGGRRLAIERDASSPIWSRDGRHILFAGRLGNGSPNNVYEVEADGASRAKAIVESFANLAPVGWLGARERLVFLNYVQQSPLPRGILIRETTTGAVIPFHVGGEGRARLSPDTTRIAFSDRGFDSADLFVDTIPAAAQPVRVWHGQPQEPRWRADGRALYFVERGHLMEVPVSGGRVPTVGTPVKLFDVPSASYAVDPKTGRFLVMVPVATPPPTVTVTLNWPRQ